MGSSCHSPGRLPGKDPRDGNSGIVCFPRGSSRLCVCGGSGWEGVRREGTALPARHHSNVPLHFHDPWGTRRILMGFGFYLPNSAPFSG